MNPPALALKPEISAETMPSPEHTAGGEFATNFDVIRAEISRPEVAGVLAEIKEYHPTTFEHVLRVSVFAAKMLEVFDDKLEPTESETGSIMRAGLLHDTGKLDISKDIWDKPGKLTDEEFDQVKEHTSRGRDRLAGIEAFSDDDMLLNLTLLHHQIQGNSYVRGDMADWIVGEEAERFKTVLTLFAMADQTEAMTGNRRYIQDQGLTKDDVVNNLKTNLEAAGRPEEIADRIADEPFFWDRELQQGYLDILVDDFERTQAKPERHLRLVGIESP